MSWICPPPPCGSTSSTTTFPTGWDAGIDWFTNRTVFPACIVDVAKMRDQVLRVVNDDVEDDHIRDLVLEATEFAEQWTQRALMPQTWEMVLNGFPSGDIVLERPPLIEVVSFGYVDADGASQSLAVSPADFQVIPSGYYRKARLRALSGASWPSGNPITVTYRAGYADQDDPQLKRIVRGIGVLVGELYKQREASVVGTSIVTAPFEPTRFWEKVY